MYVREAILWKEKERSRIRGVQMENLRGLLPIRTINRIPNARIRELCGVKKGLDERIEEGFGDAKGVYVGECVGSRSVGKRWKRWTDTVKECLRKKGLDVRQAMRMVKNRSEWRKLARRDASVVARGMNP